MLSKQQLEFIRASLTAKGAAVPCENNGEIARLFLATLDEIGAQLRAVADLPPDVKP